MKNYNKNKILVKCKKICDVDNIHKLKFKKKRNPREITGIDKDIFDEDDMIVRNMFTECKEIKMVYLYH